MSRVGLWVPLSCRLQSRGMVEGGGGWLGSGGCWADQGGGRHSRNDAGFAVLFVAGGPQGRPGVALQVYIGPCGRGSWRRGGQVRGGGGCWSLGRNWFGVCGSGLGCLGLWWLWGCPLGWDGVQGGGAIRWSSDLHSCLSESSPGSPLAGTGRVISTCAGGGAYGLGLSLNACLGHKSLVLMRTLVYALPGPGRSRRGKWRVGGSLHVGGWAA